TEDNIYSQTPKEYKLYQNYPNPFNPVTTIKYDIPKDGNISLKIYDVLSREIYSMNEFKRAGTYEFSFDGSNLPSGLYFYRIKSGNYTETKKMMLLK
ncbi:MAG: T9SS type A sorting domain-containing protein, partial [Ignavibacteria bacterium]